MYYIIYIVVGKIGKIMAVKTSKLGLVSLIALSLASIGTIAFANINLNQVDIRKSSGDGLEFTLFTSSPYADNVIVTKKSDNKYVILMPNVSGVSNSKPDISSVSDIVSNVNVRAINDGGAGYTKVTVITTKPVNIKTSTAKSAPVSEAQKEYRALIAQQKVKPAQTHTPVQTAVHSTPAFKLPEIQPTKSPADIKAEKPAAQKQTDKKIHTQTAEKKVNIIDSAKNKIKETQKQEEIKKAEKQKIKQAKAEQKELKNIVPPPPAAARTNIKTENTPKSEAAPADTPQKTGLQKNETKTLKAENKLVKIKNKISERVPKNMPMTIALIIIPVLCLMTLIKLIRASIQKSNILKKSFIDNLSTQEKPVETYENIINNENLSWQEKYKQYSNTAGNKKKPEASDAIGNSAKYNFITPKMQQETVENILNAEEEIMTEERNEDKIQQPSIDSLERILHDSPDMEKTPIDEDIELFEETSFGEIEEVKKEETSIQNQLNKSIKLKAFAQKPALAETSRNNKVKHKRVQIELPKEGRHVDLGFSQLHTNPRNFNNANLSVSDLIAKSDRLLGKKTSSIPANDYEMISVDDFLNIVEEDNKTKATSSLSDKVAETLAKSKPVSYNAPKMQKSVSNPISKTRNESKEDYLKGLIVKSGFNIDSERGFYLVNLDGVSALIGRIGEEIFVLKKFSKNIDKPLQVRMDNPNVYMVKTENFKSLVEVNDKKMGVLIEL